jgi:hypothetical protein
MKKQQWKDWAVKMIKETGRCPGSPSFGMPDSMVTEDEFKSSVNSGGTHPYNECHYLEEVMGIAMPGEMREIGVNEPAPEITQADVEKAQELLDDPQGEKTVAQLKKDLKVYVDMITLKREGVLYIPEPLLKLDTYVKKFFDVK